MFSWLFSMPHLSRCSSVADLLCGFFYLMILLAEMKNKNYDMEQHTSLGKKTNIIFRVFC
jgi:hypothetical protein